MFGLVNPFGKSILSNPEITKPITQKIYRSILVFYTSPLSRGKKVSIDKYQGIVQNIDLWYVKLKSQNKAIYIPTSFIYDQAIEIFD